MGPVRVDTAIPGYRERLDVVDADGTTRWVDEDLALKVLYNDCDQAAAHWAFSQLRPQATTPYRKSCPLDSLPDVPSTYVLCTEDRLVNPEWSRRVAQDELGATIVELPGGHSPFLSRPEQLAAVLEQEQ